MRTKGREFGLALLPLCANKKEAMFPGRECDRQEQRHLVSLFTVCPRYIDGRLATWTDGSCTD